MPFSTLSKNLFHSPYHIRTLSTTHIIFIQFTDDFFSGGGTVDFEEFVGGLSAFSSRGGREEKLRFAFKVYDMDRDDYISNGELFLVLKMMVGNNLKDAQLQQIVDKTIMEADKDGDGKLSFEEFSAMVSNTVSCDFLPQIWFGCSCVLFVGYREADDARGYVLSERSLRIPCSMFLYCTNLNQMIKLEDPNVE